MRVSEKPSAGQRSSTFLPTFCPGFWRSEENNQELKYIPYVLHLLILPRFAKLLMRARHYVCAGDAKMKKTVLAPGCLRFREKKEWEWIWRQGGWRQS